MTAGPRKRERKGIETKVRWGIDEFMQLSKRKKEDWRGKWRL